MEFGPDCARDITVGTHVCSIPALLRGDKIHTLGYSNDHPGGYAQYMRLTESFLEPVPNGLSPALAALTEPMAVGLHTVNKSRLSKEDLPLVIGCGPVGLAVIAALKQRDSAPILAADFSAKQAFRAATLGANDFFIKGKYLDIGDEVSRILRLHFRHSDGSQKPANMITELGCFRSYGLTAEEAGILEQFCKDHRFPSFNILAKELNLPEEQLEEAIEIIYKKFRVDNLAQLTHRLTLCMLFYARE